MRDKVMKKSIKENIKKLQKEVDFYERNQADIKRNAISLDEFNEYNSLADMYDAINCKYVKVDDKYIFIDITKKPVKGGTEYYAKGVDFINLLEKQGLTTDYIVNDDMKKDYLVTINAWNGVFYLTDTLEFEDSLSDKVVWDGSNWDEKSIKNYIKEDAKENDYTYRIEVL